MRCLRICGIYSYKLTKRHSTITTTALFLVVIIGVFQLHSYKHSRHHSTQRPPGDFVYKPGAFLKHKKPDENMTFCYFKYDLPNKLNWSNIRVTTPPEEGKKSRYRVIYNAIKGIAYSPHNRFNSVTYVTHATPEFIYHIVEIAKYWEGPISLAVFVPDYDLDLAMQLLSHLCKCYVGMSKVSVHLFYPLSNPPRLAREPIPEPTAPPTPSNITDEELFRKKLENYRNLNKSNRAQYVENARKNKIKTMMVKMPYRRTMAPTLDMHDCSGLESYSLPTYRKEYNMIYPVNVGRNAARKAAITNYFLVSDIELLPSSQLATKFLSMLRKLLGETKWDSGCVFSKTVFVVPLFEVAKGEEIPRDKDTLVEMVNSNRAQYFHQKSCSHCQRFPGIQTWLKNPTPDNLKPMLVTRREYPYHRWEPLYFGTQKEPWYSESLSWEGQQEKMTQMLELCLQEYRMIILDGGFLCHAASTSKPRDKKEDKINSRKYAKIIEQLKAKYPERPSCKVDWGCK